VPRGCRYLFLIAAIALVSGECVSIASATATASGCKEPTRQTLGGSPPRLAARAGAKATAANLTPANDNSKVVDRNFGDSRSVYRRQLLFLSDRPIAPNPRQISVSIAGGLVDPTTTDVFPVDNGQVTFGAAIDRNTPNMLTITLCLDPSHPEAAPPGQYAGTMLITGPRITPAQIPVTLTLKSSRVGLVWVLGAVGLALGLFVKWLADKLNPRESNPDHPRLRFLGMLVVGIVLTIGVVDRLYYEPTTFADMFANYWPIVLGAATATAGGTTLVDLFKGT
jgi:hypothetical protein